MLVKGPVGFQKKNALKEKCLEGIYLAALAVVSVWYVPMIYLHGRGFIDQFFGVHNYLRWSVSEHPVNNFWYYYIIVFFVGTLPWSLMVFRAKPFGIDRFSRFLLIWVGVVLIIFQSAATKYHTYIFPASVPIAILFAKSLSVSLIKKVSLLAAVFLFCANFIGAAVANRHSAKDAALAFSSREALFVNYGRFYRGSFVFYSGKELFRLVKSEDLPALLPDNHSWTAVNVMPFITFEQLPSSPIIALVDNELIDDFYKNSHREYSILAEYAHFKVLEVY